MFFSRLHSRTPVLAISLALARSRFVQLNRFFNERQTSAATTTTTRHDNFSSCSTRHLTLAYELERNGCCCCCFICVVRLRTYNRNHIHTDTHIHICRGKRHVTFLCCFCCCQLVEGELSAWIFASLPLLPSLLLLPTSLLCSLFSARCTSSVRLMCFEFLMKFFAFELIAAVAAQQQQHRQRQRKQRQQQQRLPSPKALLLLLCCLCLNSLLCHFSL